MSLAIKVSRAETTGDPGLGSFFKKALGGVGRALGAASGIIPGAGIVGSVIERATGRRARPRQPVVGRPGLGITRRAPQVPPPGRRTRFEAGVLPPRFELEVERGTRGRVATTPRGEVQPVGMKLACPGGHHPNKSDYFLKDGTFVPKGTRCVKNRRRNPANPRALDRAIGRLNAGKKLQRKLRGFETDKFTKTGKKKN